MRALRLYDEMGRITEENLTMHDPGAFVSFHEDPRINSAGKSWLRAQAGGRWVKFFYDSENVVRTLRQQEPGKEETIVTTYNEHGDPVVEITTTTSGDSGESASYSEMRYTYRYDQAGNWTERVAEYRSSPQGTFQAAVTVRRTLEYF